MRGFVDYRDPYSESHPTIRWLWKVVNEFSHEQKTKFLFFFSSNANLPLGGFPALGVRFSIEYEADATRLPVTRTCGYTMYLPNYRSEAELRRKLLMAIEASEEGMFRA